MVNSTFHPHVWFKNSGDVFRHNIVGAGYLPIGISAWGKEIDYNAFPDSASLAQARFRGTDMHSVYGPMAFESPESGDFRVKTSAVVLSAGFKNFSMNNFGVVSERLKAIAEKPLFPAIAVANNLNNDYAIDFMGARVKNLSTAGEQSATGMDQIRGVLVLSVAQGSAASEFLQANDVILIFNRRPVGNLKELLEARGGVSGKDTEVVIFRNQHRLKQKIEVKM